MQGDLRGAIEADGEFYGAEAAVDVELRAVEVEEARRVELAHGGKGERRQEGKANLTAVGVAGEEDIGEHAARMADDGVGEVRFVAHHEEWGVEMRGDGALDVRSAAAGVVQAGEPEALAVALDGDVLVDQGLDVVGSQCFEDFGRADVDVVVAQRGVAQGRLDAAEDLAASARGVDGVADGTGAIADVVAGEQDHVGLEDVDAVDGIGEEGFLGELCEMDVAELRDAEAMEGFGQVADAEGGGDGFEFVAGDLGGGEEEAGEGEAGAGKKTAAGEVKMLEALPRGEERVGGTAAGRGVRLRRIEGFSGHGL